MNPGRIIVTFDSLRKMLGLSEEIKITNVIRLMYDDLSSESFSVFVLNKKLPNVPEGTEIPHYPVWRINEICGV